MNDPKQQQQERARSTSQGVRLDNFRISAGLRWQDVAARLGVSVPMLMLVKTGKRNLSAKVEHKLAKAESELSPLQPDYAFWRDSALALARTFYGRREELFQLILLRRENPDSVAPLAAALLKSEQLLNRMGIETDLDATPKGEFTMCQMMAWRTHFGTVPDAMVIAADSPTPPL